MHPQTKPFQRENSNARRPFKPKAWSHQDELKSLIGKKVIITFAASLDIDTNWSIGTLINADQFTLQLQHNDKSIATYFKSSLMGYNLSASQ